jgi:hypothetical protein
MPAFSLLYVAKSPTQDLSKQLQKFSDTISNRINIIFAVLKYISGSFSPLVKILYKKKLDLAFILEYDKNIM